MIQECSHMKRILSAWENTLKKTGKESCDLNFFKMKDCSQYVFCTFHPGVTDKLAIVFQIMLDCPVCVYLQKAISKDWPFRVLHLKDCFYTINIHIDNKVYFSFSVPSFNQKEPQLWYQWTVLPSRHDKIPYMCHYYAGNVLEPVRNAFPQAYIS